MNKAIWIVDDDHAILEVTRIVLEEEGYKVATVMSEEGLNKMLKTGKPDLFLLDILLSGSDGRDIAKKLKGNKKTGHIPIVMMSADIRTLEKCGQILVDDCIRKPFDIYDLIGKIKKLT